MSVARLLPIFCFLCFALVLPASSTICSFVAEDLTEVPSSNFSASCTEIWLSENQLSALNSADFQNLFSIQKIKLEQNGMTSVSKDAFINCTELTTLYFSANLLTEFPEFSDPVKAILKHLDLRDNNISSIGSGRISGFPQLSTLRLQGNALSSFASDAVSNVPELSDLAISISPKQFVFAKCKCNLQKLHFYDISVFPDLTEFTNLSYLYFSKLMAKQISLKMIPNFSGLDDLVFYFNDGLNCNDCETRASLVKLKKDSKEVAVTDNLCMSPHEQLHLDNVTECDLPLLGNPGNGAAKAASGSLAAAGILLAALRNLSS